MVLILCILVTFLLTGLTGSVPTVTITSASNVTYGGDLTLTCQVDQDVKLGYVVFIRNGSNIVRITNTCTYSKENTLDTYAYNVTCNLPMIFRMVRLTVNYTDHNTIWSCQMYSVSGSNGTCVSNPCSSPAVSVSIQGPPFVRLYPNFPVYNVTEGTDNVTFTCVVIDANPLPTQNSYGWLYQGSFIQGQNLSSYIIPRIQRSNDGSHQCKASNAYGNGYSQVMQLGVQYGPVVFLPNSKEIQEGDTLQVTCNVSANPAPSVVWYKSDMTVSVSSNLAIPSISRSQEGNYTCTANNVLYPTGQLPVNKTASNTLNVTILYGPGNSTTIHTVPLSSVYEVAVNQTAGVIVCNASCKPRCSYNWYKNGTTINKTDTLSLGVVQRSSEGNYTCEAYNTILQNITSRSTVSIYVRVKYAPMVNVSSGYNAELLVVKLGQTDVVLNCVVTESYPQPSSFIWTQNGTELQRNIRSNYSITVVTRETNGIWGCTGNNTYGTPVEDYMDIEVQFGPVVNITENKTLHEGESLSVECIVDANPPAFDVFWSKYDDATFYRNTTELRFHRVSRHDSGTYICTAVNQIRPSGQNNELLNGTQRFYLVVKFDETSSVGPVVGGVLAAIVVLALLAVALFLIKRRGYSLRSCIKLGAVPRSRQNAGESNPNSSEIRSSLSQRTEPIYANTTQDHEESSGDYVGLQVNRGRASSYLQLKDVRADNNGETNARLDSVVPYVITEAFRQSDGDAYDNQHVYMNYEGQSDSLQHPEIQTEGEQELYANQQKRT